jgi:ABC-type sugar transport system substrate-binding protein
VRDGPGAGRPSRQDGFISVAPFESRELSGPPLSFAARRRIIVLGGNIALTKHKVLVSLLSDDQEFQVLQAQDARATAPRLGLAVEIVFAENNSVLQIQQLFKAVHAPEAERPRAIVVETVVGEGLERVARNAAQAGVGWVLLNRHVPYLEELRARHASVPIFAIGTDQEEVGRIQARHFRAFLPAGGLVLYIQGPADTSAARERLIGAQQGLAGSAIELRVLEGLWTEQSGEQAVARWLRLKSNENVRADLIGCQNDAMALGARRAIDAIPDEARRRALSALPITGCDGLPEGGQRLVDLRKLAATVICPSNAGPALDALANAFATNRMPEAKIVLAPASYPAETNLGKAAAAWAKPH